MRIIRAVHVKRHFMILPTGSRGAESLIFAFGTFLDIEGAFDNVSFNSMIMASLEHDVNGTSTKRIDSMLKNRTARAEVRGVSSVMEVR
jgi:hypothetical protein